MSTTTISDEEFEREIRTLKYVTNISGRLDATTTISTAISSLPVLTIATGICVVGLVLHQDLANFLLILTFPPPMPSKLATATPTLTRPTMM
jgi:hypothetical protein